MCYAHSGAGVVLPQVLPSGPVEVVIRGDPGNRPSGTLSPYAGFSVRAPALSASRNRCFRIVTDWCSMFKSQGKMLQLAYNHYNLLHFN